MTFTVEVKVGSSSWPRGREYITLLPATTFMTPVDIRRGKNKAVIKMLNKGLSSPLEVDIE